MTQAAPYAEGHDTNGHIANGNTESCAHKGYHFDNETNPTIKNPSPLRIEPEELLKVIGNQITLKGQPIRLRGACLGGWMLMEQFITGFAGQEHQLRAGMRNVLGQDKYDFFFDKFLEYFFTEADAIAFRDMGFNCIRLGFNYHHFEDDMNPRVFKSEGLKHLDRVIDICARHGIYSVIDFHALPGGQSSDWHCDNPTDKALFWVHKDFQDRAVIIWEHLAEHYKNNTWVAGYNVLNEPMEETGHILNAVMARMENAIRAIDPHHILFWDGNTFGSDFRTFGKPFPNSVYACHDYSTMGLPNNPEYYGTVEDKARLSQSFAWKSEYQRTINGPIWNGEFGPTYVDPEDNPDHEAVNNRRYDLLMEQLRIYNSLPNVSWTIWCWKDVGICGLFYLDPQSEYMKLVKPFIRRKRAAGCEPWGTDISHLDYLFKPMWDWLCDVAPSMRTRYPRIFAGTRGKHLFRPVRLCLLSEELLPDYCELFRGKTFEELDGLAKCFHFDKCLRRDRLSKMLLASVST